MARWDEANKISGEILDILNKRIPDVRPSEMLAGTCLALIALLDTAKSVPERPPSFDLLNTAARYCLQTMGAEFGPAPKSKKPRVKKSGDPNIDPTPESSL